MGSFAAMQFLRNHVIVSRWMAFVTGMLFLNVSFFAIEVRILSLRLKDPVLIENIGKLLVGSGTEEEQDVTDSKEDVSGKEVDIFFNSHLCQEVANGYVLKLMAYAFSQHKVSSGVYDRPTQPPEA
ncbi:MAG TPA: hypothetical protein VEB86_07595 [Chryseosolibacter sp.]|nr:hypothetical protein [Chryseosolibacter sp.]